MHFKVWFVSVRVNILLHTFLTWELMEWAPGWVLFAEDACLHSLTNFRTGPVSLYLQRPLVKQADTCHVFDHSYCDYYYSINIIPLLYDLYSSTYSSFPVHQKWIKSGWDWHVYITRSVHFKCLKTKYSKNFSIVLYLLLQIE